jgi:hypothetical protein
MKTNWVMLSLASVLAAASAVQLSSQERQIASAAHPDTAAVSHTEDVTPVLVELRKGINAKKAKVGDDVKAQVVQDVISHGKIVIRRGSKLVGHVTQVKTSTKEDAESHLGMVFDRALLKGGGELNLNSAGIQALAAAIKTSLVDKPDEMLPSSISSTNMNQGGAPNPIGGRPQAGRGVAAPATPPPSLGNSTVSVPVAINTERPFEGSVLSGGSRGVFGIPGIKLQFDHARNADKTVVVSATRNVKLESGIQLLLQVTSPLIP